MSDHTVNLAVSGEISGREFITTAPGVYAVESSNRVRRDAVSGVNRVLPTIKLKLSLISSVAVLRYAHTWRNLRIGLLHMVASTSFVSF